MNFIFEIKLQKKHFLAKYDHFSVADVSYLNPCQDGNVHKYATTKQLKNKEFKTKRENIKVGLGIKVAFMSEIKVHK